MHLTPWIDIAKRNQVGKGICEFLRPWGRHCRLPVQPVDGKGDVVERERFGGGVFGRMGIFDSLGIVGRVRRQRIGQWFGARRPTGMGRSRLRIAKNKSFDRRCFLAA